MKFETWQEFEEVIKNILEKHGFKTSLRVFFSDSQGRSEIDVIAERFGVLIAIDAKLYSAEWYRASALRKEARKHAKRCKRFARVIGKGVFPVIVSLIDDKIIEHSGCVVVPFYSLNDFLLNISVYLEEFRSCLCSP